MAASLGKQAIVIGAGIGGLAPAAGAVTIILKMSLSWNVTNSRSARSLVPGPRKHSTRTRFWVEASARLRLLPGLYCSAEGSRCGAISHGPRHPC